MRARQSCVGIERTLDGAINKNGELQLTGSTTL